MISGYSAHVPSSLRTHSAYLPGMVTETFIEFVESRVSVRAGSCGSAHASSAVMVLFVPIGDQYTSAPGLMMPVGGSNVIGVSEPG